MVDMILGIKLKMLAHQGREKMVVTVELDLETIALQGQGLNNLITQGLKNRIIHGMKDLTRQQEHQYHLHLGEKLHSRRNALSATSLDTP